MAEKKTRMMGWIDYRVKVTTSDKRVLVGTFLAFDKYMNLVLGDAEEFRKLRPKGSNEERELKRVLGLTVLRGECVVSMTAESPPPNQNRSNQMTAGPGRAAVAGRGAPIAGGGAGAGLTAPVRGVGGPAASQMQPRGARPPGMPM